MKIDICHQSYEINGIFQISRSALSQIDVVQVSCEDQGFVGRGECRPYARYGETVKSVIADINAVKSELQLVQELEQIQDILPPGAARNAVDCAFWDLVCKKQNLTIWEILQLEPPISLQTAFTLSIDSPENMAQKAAGNILADLLKVKLGHEDGLDIERLKAIYEARPDAKLIVDANEGWTGKHYESMMDACMEAKVALIEQPLPEGQESSLPQNSPIPICADESLHTSADLERLRPYYQAINIKLDKAGGLTQGLAMVKKARELDFQIMAGCMLSTSLAMAPAYIIASFADVIDLDGPLLLAQDVSNPIEYQGTHMQLPSPLLWG